MNHASSLAASLEPHQRQKLALKVLSQKEAIRRKGSEVVIECKVES
jgi:hypothetical protein